MKTIGLLGGMSWESTVHYYQIINEEVQNELGGLHSAKIILYSVEFAEIEQYQSSGQWARCGEILGKAAKSLETAGADFIDSPGRPTDCFRNSDADDTHRGRNCR